MNRTVKDAIVEVHHYNNLQSEKAFAAAYNYAEYLEAERGRTPLSGDLRSLHNGPFILKINPHHLILGSQT